MDEQERGGGGARIPIDKTIYPRDVSLGMSLYTAYIMPPPRAQPFIGTHIANYRGLY